MTETTHTIGRIAALTLFTLLFAAAWRSDESGATGGDVQLTRVARGATDAPARRGSDAGALPQAMFDTTRGMARDRRYGGRTGERLLASVAAAATLPSGPIFSGTPALLGRSSDSGGGASAGLPSVLSSAGIDSSIAVE